MLRNVTAIFMSLPAKIESLLFVSAEPLSLERIGKIAQEKKKDAAAALAELLLKYAPGANVGMTLVKIGDNYQLLTNPRHASIVSRYLKADRDFELTEPGLETLAIIAYRGPLTKPEIEQIRGVNCALILRNLLLRALIEKIGGQEESLSRYQITHEFLRFLGVSEVKDLPDYDKLSKDKSLVQILDSTNEFPLTNV